MASAAIFSSLRRSRSPSLDAFLAPVHLENDVVGLLKTLSTVASDIINSFSDKTPSFQKRNTRSLLRKVDLFVVLLDSVRNSGESGSNLPSTVVLCFKELYLLLYRSKILLDYCTYSTSNSIREETDDKLERLGSKLATNSKDQGGKWLFLNYWSKTVKMTKPQGAKRKFTLNNMLMR
ncbi:hypothetical protein HanPI659440_Chr04g0168151 [Helianthus annuus]|nr:hypothetical protein HanPI659440_Chr04g0168151 [Helianthus annuus]